MTFKQKLLKLVYPLLMFSRRLNGKKQTVSNAGGVRPPQSFYSLSAELNNGKHLGFESLRGKKVLIVNTASLCGYTAQYDELQKLYQHSKEDLEIIAFPANDFKNQETGSDEEIANFCVTQFSIRFPLAKKTSVLKGPEQHPVYKWLSSKAANGWNEAPPTWNFSKYLVNEEGMLTHYFDPAVSPLSEDVIRAVNE